MSETATGGAEPVLQRLRYSISIGGVELCVLAALIIGWTSAIGFVIEAWNDRTPMLDMALGRPWGPLGESVATGVHGFGSEHGDAGARVLRGGTIVRLDDVASLWSGTMCALRLAMQLCYLFSLHLVDRALRSTRSERPFGKLAHRCRWIGLWLALSFVVDCVRVGMLWSMADSVIIDGVKLDAGLLTSELYGWALFLSLCAFAAVAVARYGENLELAASRSPREAS